MATQVPKQYVQWILATATAAVLMLSYIHQFVYPRTEGEKLERRVSEIATKQDSNMEKITQKFDKIYEILLELRRQK